MSRAAHCPIGRGFCDFMLLFAGETDKERFGAVATHVMRVHGAGPGEAFEAAGQSYPHVWAWYMRDAAEHPERYQRAQ